MNAIIAVVIAALPHGDKFNLNERRIIMRVKEQKAMWQSNSMGALDGLKLKFNNFIIPSFIFINFF